jgi:sn-glycerol 3-phosphate transport system substrate-binding protein
MRRPLRSVMGSLAIAAVAASVGMGALPAAARRDAKCPVTALDRAPKPVEITFWHAQVASNEDALHELVTRFETQQDRVRVKLVNQVTEPDLFNKYRAGLTTGTLPDLAEMNVLTLQSLVDSRSVVPIEACITADGYRMSDYVPRAIAAYTLQGVQWAMPWTVSNRVLLYDRNVFRAAGLDPDHPPTTLDEVTEYSRRIVERGAARHGIALPINPGLLAHLYTKSGQLYVNHDNGRAARATKTLLDNQTGRHIWTWWDHIVDSGLGINTGRAETDHLLAVGNGDAAMTIDSSEAVGPVFDVLSKGEFSHVDPGVAPLPALETGGGVMVGGGSLWLPRASSPEKQAAAWEFVKFLSAPEQQATLTVRTRGGYLPIRRSAVQDPALQQMWQQDPRTRVAYDQLLQGPTNPISAGPVLGDPSGTGDAVVDALTRMLAGDLAPKNAPRQAQHDANTSLAEYNDRVRS